MTYRAAAAVLVAASICATTQAQGTGIAAAVIANAAPKTLSAKTAIPVQSPATQTAPAPADNSNGRALPSPLSSPPFPLSDWLGEWVVGEPYSAPTNSLQKALFGNKLDKSGVLVYGYIDAGANISTSHESNFPNSYGLYANHAVLDQAVVRIERVPDTVQTKKVDYGFRFTSLYGIDYRFTTAKGWFSDQLLKRNSLYGYDPVELFGLVYLPKVGEGTLVTIGRYISPPDIEAQLSVYNYMYSHSLMFTVDAYTYTGINAMTRINPYWSILYGIHFGNDMAPWTASASLNGQLMARWVSKDNNDSVWAGIDSWGSGEFNAGHDNLQEFNATWQHKFDNKWHMMTEMYYEYEYDALVGGSVIYGPGEPWYENVGAGKPLPGKSDATGVVNYLQYQLSGKDYLSFRTDYLNDPRGERTGYPTAYGSLTLAYSRYLTPSMVFRPEVRYEQAFANNVSPYDNGNRKTQWTLAADVIWKF